MDKIYVCSPFRGLDGDYKKNTEYAREAARRVFTRGDIPIVPHLMLPQIMDDCDENEREKAINMGLELLDTANIIEVYCKYGISKGMEIEINRAKLKGKALRFLE